MVFQVASCIVSNNNSINILSSQTAQISNYAPLSGAAFTGAIAVNGLIPLYSIPSTVALLAGATFTGAVTTTGLSIVDNSLNFNIGTTSYVSPPPYAKLLWIILPFSKPPHLLGHSPAPLLLVLRELLLQMCLMPELFYGLELSMSIIVLVSMLMF